MPTDSDLAVLAVTLDELGADDTERVGGKNASLGEMISALRERGVRVPGGFATTAEAYRRFVAANGLADPIREAVERWDAGDRSLEATGRAIRKMIMSAEMPAEIAAAIKMQYRQLCEREGGGVQAVAVRSSATAEDLPEASFAGQQETFLNIRGADHVVEACQRCYASLFTDRALAYRREQGFDHLVIALSVGVQRMVRSDRAGSGVMFSLDTDTGFPDVVVIDAAWGLGETVVQGTVDPDGYRVFKPLLERPGCRPIVGKRLGAKERKMVYARGSDAPTRIVETSRRERERFVLDDDEILTLARWACAIESHYGHPMDMEWAKDGPDGELTIVQARPETVHSRRGEEAFDTYALREEPGPEALRCQGLAIGQAIASGPVCRLDDPEQGERFPEGAVLVTGMTDPDWVPIMKRAAAIVTDHGGRTSHAAIVSRELGVAAVVGCGDATEVLAEDETVTVSCAEGDSGYIYAGELAFDRERVDLEELGEPPVAIDINIATPSAAFQWWKLPVSGIGLARLEFLINNVIGIHPMALVEPDAVDRSVRREIARRAAGWDDPREFFVDTLARGIAAIACSRYPDPVVVRCSDFKTNEYADLLGGKAFEADEANPMLGFRGAARYVSDDYRAGFALECAALKRAREEIGLDNIVIMLPFVRTPEEADRALEVLAANGLVRGSDGLQIKVMCEIPSNVLCADEFAERFDGFSIGSNDLTQLILGIDRDSDRLRHEFDERHVAVKRAITQVIERAHHHRCEVGICGQAPSDHPEFAEFLIEAGIDRISLNPDSVIPVLRRIAGT